LNLLNAFFPNKIKASSKVYVNVAVIRVVLKNYLAKLQIIAGSPKNNTPFAE
jgi:hypothetical protein